MSSDLKQVYRRICNYNWPSEDEYFQDTENFTVLLPIYINDDLENFVLSVKSVFMNTVKPSEILISQDGPVSIEMENFLIDLIKKYPKVISLNKSSVNKGLGPNLASGVIVARNKLIARMDADDIADQNRFKQQLEKFKKNNDLDIISSNISEFDKEYEIKSIRNVPITNDEIYMFAKMRSPFNHPAVMYKRETILEVGNYRSIKNLEDYDLFVRLIQANKKCENIPKNLVYMRTANNMYSRRGGKNYFIQYFHFRNRLLTEKFISRREFIISISGLFVTSFSPVIVRKLVYKLFLRKK